MYHPPNYSSTLELIIKSIQAHDFNTVLYLLQTSSSWKVVNLVVQNLLYKMPISTTEKLIKLIINKLDIPDIGEYDTKERFLQELTRDILPLLDPAQTSRASNRILQLLIRAGAKFETGDLEDGSIHYFTTYASDKTIKMALEHGWPITKDIEPNEHLEVQSKSRHATYRKKLIGFVKDRDWI
jgi:hypothetical protein